MVDLGTILVSFGMENAVERLIRITGFCSLGVEFVIDYFEGDDVPVLLFSVIGEGRIHHDTVHIDLVIFAVKCVHGRVVDLAFLLTLLR